MLADYLLKTAATRLAKVLRAAVHAGDEDKITRIAQQLTTKDHVSSFSPTHMYRDHVAAFNRIQGAGTAGPSRASALAETVEIGNRIGLKEALPRFTQDPLAKTLNERVKVPADASASVVREGLKKYRQGKHKTVSTIEDSPVLERGWKGSWAAVNPDDWVPFRHAGGHEHIQDFISGKSKGYKLEGEQGESGLQVHPLLHSPEAWVNSVRKREGLYAVHKTHHYIDQPGTLTGEIQAKHLLAAPNSYEAGLPSAAAPHIRNAQITKLPWNKSNVDQSPAGAHDWVVQMNKKYNLNIPHALS